MNSPPSSSASLFWTESNMEQSKGLQQPGLTFHPVNSNITAGNDIKIVNMTVNNNPESSILNRLKNALSPVTSAGYDSYEARQRSECFPNTRVQVLNDIEAWLQDESHRAPIYILDGVAGIGKSTIAQTIAIRAASAGLLGASFFFSRDEDLRKIARHFFPTIAYQLSCYDDRFATCINLSLDRSPDAAAKLLDQQLLLLLLEPLQEVLSHKYHPMLVVIDALDECEEDNAEELLSLLGQHVHRMKGMKVLITMRPEAHLRDVLDQEKNHERFRLHEIENLSVHSDIRLYLQSRLSMEEIRKASRNRRASWQPTTKDMDMLCGICGTLFIVASTATKFILDRKRLNPEKQLARLLDGVSSSDFSGSKHTSILDETYVRIILAAQSDMDESDDEWFRDLNRVLGALITLASPIPCDGLASLLDMNPDDVDATLSQLHSLVAPSGSGETTIFRIHHKSFPDFITDRARIQQVLSRWKLSPLQEGLDSLLWVDIGAQHLQLAKACLRVMNHGILSDIDPRDWLKNKDRIFPDAQGISPDLVYAALHWAAHLHSAQRLEEDLELQDCLDVWASRNILSWMEVMVILNQVNEMHGILHDAIGSMKPIVDRGWTERVRVRELLSDASRSCLPFVPAETSLAKAYNSKAMTKIGLGKSCRWDPLLATLIGHSKQVNTVAFSRDGSRLASGAGDNSIRLWNAKTGAHLSTLSGHLDWVRSVAFSNNDFKLASGSDDKTVRLWDTKTGEPVLNLTGHSDWVCSVAFSNQGSLLASGSKDKTIRLWDARTGTHISTLVGHTGWVTSLAFSSDNSQMASGSGDKTIRLWDLQRAAHVTTLVGHLNWVKSVAFSGEGSRLASGSDDQTIRLWDTKTGVHISTLTCHPHLVSSVAFSSDGFLLASGSQDKIIQLWDATTGAHIASLSGHSHSVNSIAFSGDGARLASASVDTTVRIWDLQTGTSTDLSAFPGHMESVCSVVFSDDGSKIASASFDKTIQLWDVTSAAHKCTLRGHSDKVYSIAFSRDGSRLASGSEDSTVRLWDVREGMHLFSLIGHSDWVRSVAFSSDGAQLASGSDDTTIRLWDVRTGSHVLTLSGHSHFVHSVAFSTDGSQLASGSYDHTIRLWDAKTGAHLLTFAGHLERVESVAFSNDGFRLASGANDGTIRFWDAKTARHISTLTTLSSSSTLSIVFLPDDFQTLSQPAPHNHQLLQFKNQDHFKRILALVKRRNPPITGLIMFSSLSRTEDDSNCEVTELCWFPPDMEAASFAFNHVNSLVAIGCKNGRIMVLDLSSDISPQLVS